MVYCPNCNSYNNLNNKFCGECGQELPKIPNYCPKCKLSFNFGEKFCTNCGKKLINKEQYQEQISRQNQIKQEKKDRLVRKYMELDDITLYYVCNYFSIKYTSKERVLRYLLNNYTEHSINQAINSAKNLTDSLNSVSMKNGSMKILSQIEEKNTTTESIFSLEDHEVLIILNNGKNLTNWSDLKYVEKSDILFIREDLSGIKDIRKKYRLLPSLKVIIISGISNKVNNMKRMFMGCKNLEYILLLGDVSNVTNMKQLFSACSSLSNIASLELWDVSNVTHMGRMFDMCHSLTDISPLSNWNVSNVTDMHAMFAGCSSLTDISPLSNWDVSNVIRMERIFDRCPSSFPHQWNLKKI